MLVTVLRSEQEQIIATVQSQSQKKRSIVKSAVRMTFNFRSKIQEEGDNGRI